MKSNPRRWFREAGLWLLLACSLPRLARAAELSIHRWTGDDGLPQNRISALAQTPDGYLWCGTWFGVARFDGVKFTSFDHNRVAAFRDDAVNSLAVDRIDGSLWVGTRDGLLRYAKGDWRRLGTGDGLPGPMVWRLLPRTKGGVWLDCAGRIAVATDHGIVWVSAPIGTAPDGPADETIRQLVSESGDVLTFLTDSGPKRIRFGEPMASTQPVPGFSSPAWRAVLMDAEGRLVTAGTEEGLATRVDSRWNWVATSRQGWSEQTPVLHRDPTGVIWGAPRTKGLGQLRDGEWKPVALMSGRPPTDLTRALKDREGGLWLGTSDGLFRVHTAAARTYGVRDGLPDDDVWSVHEGTDGTLWVGSSRGAARRRGERFESIREETWPGVAWCRALWASRPGEVWFGFQGFGIVRENQGTNQPPLSHATLGDTGINCLYGDRSGRLWIGNGHGAFSWTDGRMEPWPVVLPPGDGPPSVKVIHQDRRGKLWFGTARHGLVGWNNGTTSRFTRRDGLASDTVWAIHEDRDGVLWLGGNQGLSRFVPPVHTGTGEATKASHAEVFAFGPRHGLPDETINQVLEDDAGFLWLATLRGILRVGRTELGSVARGKAGGAVVSMFGTADGMESSETNGESQPAGCKTRDGRIWFPTTRGVTVFDPAALPRAEQAPTAVIEEAMADDRVLLRDGVRDPDRQPRRSGARGAAVSGPAAVPGTGQARIESGQARLVRFRFTAPTFVNAGRARFRHRLLGLDEAWRDAGEERAANFTNLKPGDYTFEVTACNAHGVWQESPDRFSFTLVPAFAQTVWFPVSIASASLGLVVGIAGWRLRWQRRSLRAEQAAAVADERSRIARDLHDELGTALTGVGLELEVLRRAAAPPQSDRLAEAAARTRTLAERMREVVWAVNPRCDTIPSLALFLEQHAVPFLRSAGIACRLDYPEDLPRIPLAAQLRHQLALGVRETLTNVVRHSHATEVWLRLRLAHGWLVVEVADNGRGFDIAKPGAGEEHGLSNLRARLAALGGRFECMSHPGRGTHVSFHVPIRNDPPPSNP